MESHFSGLGSFWMFFGVSREPWGTHWSLSWVTLRTLGVLGVILGASWDPSGAQLGDFVPSWEPCVANLCICVVILSPLGSGVTSSILGLRIKFFVLSLEATGWVCRYWWSRFRSRLNCIPNCWMLLHQLGDLFPLGSGVASGWVCGYGRIRFRSRLNYILMVEYVVDNIFGFYHILLKCSWHHSRACKPSSVIGVVSGCLQISTINQRHQHILMYVLQS